MAANARVVCAGGRPAAGGYLQNMPVAVFWGKVMGEAKRFDLFFERHFGFGLRWDSMQFPLHLSIAIPFVTFTVGIGRANR